MKLTGICNLDLQIFYWCLAGPNHTNLVFPMVDMQKALKDSEGYLNMRFAVAFSDQLNFIIIRIIPIKALLITCEPPGDMIYCKSGVNTM
jgi:hypothetical protein